MSDPDRLFHGPGTPLTPGVALGGYALAVACFFSIGLMIGGGPGPATIAELLALAGVPVLLVRLHGGGRADLGLVAPPLLGVVGAVVAGAGIWLVAHRLAAPVAHATHAGPTLRAISRDLLAGDVVVVLVARALVPAVCEELLHRGLLLGALSPRLGRGLAIVVVAALFAVMHQEPARMVASGLVGLVAGALATWSRSVGPAIVVHLVNNTIVLGLGLRLWPSGFGEAVGRHPDPALAVAFGLVGIGLLLAWIGRQRS